MTPPQLRTPSHFLIYSSASCFNCDCFLSSKLNISWSPQICCKSSKVQSSWFFPSANPAFYFVFNTSCSHLIYFCAGLLLFFFKNCFHICGYDCCATEATELHLLLRAIKAFLTTLDCFSCWALVKPHYHCLSPDFTTDFQWICCLWWLTSVFFFFNF